MSRAKHSTHEMKLAAMSFAQLKAGGKTLELRLFDEKRQLLQLGDVIVFSKFPKAEEKLSLQVAALLRYPDFASLINDVPAAWLGIAESDKAALITTMFTIYTPEDEQAYGVLGIRLQRF